MLTADKNTAINTLESFMRWDLDEVLNQYPGPVHAIAAAHFFNEDAFTSRYSERIQTSLIQGAGHFVMMDAPDAFNRALAEILNS